MDSEINSVKKNINLKFLKRIQCDFLELTHRNKEEKVATFPYKQITQSHVTSKVVLNKSTPMYQKFLDRLQATSKLLLVSGQFLHVFLNIFLTARALNFEQQLAS